MPTHILEPLTLLFLAVQLFYLVRAHRLIPVGFQVVDINTAPRLSKKNRTLRFWLLMWQTYDQVDLLLNLFYFVYCGLLVYTPWWPIGAVLLFLGYPIPPFTVLNLRSKPLVVLRYLGTNLLSIALLGRILLPSLRLP